MCVFHPFFLFLIHGISSLLFVTRLVGLLHFTMLKASIAFPFFLRDDKTIIRQTVFDSGIMLDEKHEQNRIKQRISSYGHQKKRLFRQDLLPNT